MPSLTQKIEHKSDMARKILTEMRSRVRANTRRMQDFTRVWRDAEERALAYLPEREVDTRRKTVREGGLPQYTTIQIPYTYAVLMSTHTYLSSVFMGRNPVFQVNGRHGEPQQSVQAMEALLDYQTLVGQLLAPLYTWIYDAGKFGIGVMGTYWDRREEVVSEISMQPRLDPLLGSPILGLDGRPMMDKMKVSRRLPTYSGNTFFNLQPWDFIFDVSFPAREFQRGEYCGMRRTLSWNECKRREAQGYYMNLEHIPAGTQRTEDYAGHGSDQVNRPESNEEWVRDAEFADGLDRKHPQLVRIYELYVEIIPKEWGLGNSDFPEKWIFTFTEDFSVLIGAQPHGAYHCKYPFHVLVVEPEGYGLVPRGMPATLEPIQNTIDWLINSHFYNVRAALNNKFVVDPSRVVMKDVLDPLPGGIIRMKPEAYGTDTRLPMTQMPVADVTQNHLRDLQMMYGMGERTVGVNDQIMGMLNSGGRKTATEIRTSTSFGVNRLKTIAEYFSVIGFAPLAQQMISNSQQYYDDSKKFRIAGDLMMNAGQNFMDVTPESIMGFYDFVPVDGALPIDRFAQANLWREMMGQLRQIPEIALTYDFARMFEWVAQLAGLKNITQFKAQVVPDEMLLQQARMGNTIPLGGNRPPRRGGPGNGGRPGASGNIEPGQVPGMGATV